MRSFEVNAKIEKFIEEELSGWKWSDYGIGGVGTDDVSAIMDDVRQSLPLTVYIEKGDFFEETEYRRAYQGWSSSLDGMQGNYGITIASELDMNEEKFLEWYEKYGEKDSMRLV
jgi:hypothetical protein